MSKAFDDLVERNIELTDAAFSMGDLRDQCIISLKKPQQMRTSEDQEIIQQYAKTIRFFKIILDEQGENKFQDICNNLNYSCISPEETLYKSGEIGSTFYVILQGSVEVFINVPQQRKDGTKHYERSKVNELSVDKCFGELALTGEASGARKETIVAKQDTTCHFATLERVAYRNVLSHLAKSMEEHIEFLETVPFFKYIGWSGRSIQQWIRCFEKKVYSRHQVIYKEGDDCNDVYLIRSGEVRSQKEVDIKNKKTSFIIDGASKFNPYQQGLVTKQVELATVDKGQFFGEEETVFSYYLKHKAEWMELYSDGKGNVLPERIALMKKIESLINREWLAESPESSKPIIKQSPEEINFKTNTLNRVKRESTVIVKSSKVELWKISAYNFFLQLEANPYAYNYLLSKIEVGRKRREEKLPNLAMITPTSNTFKGRRQRLTPSDESFISALKQRKYSKHVLNNKPPIKKQNSIEKKPTLADTSLEMSSALYHTFTEAVDHSVLYDKKYALETSAFIERTPTQSRQASRPASILKRLTNPNKNMKPLNIPTTQEVIQKKLDSMLFVQSCFSHTVLSPKKKKKGGKLDKTEERIHKISFKNLNSLLNSDRSHDSASPKRDPSPPPKLPAVAPKNIKRGQSLNNSQISVRQRTKSVYEQKSLYDESSPHCLFPKNPPPMKNKSRVRLPPAETKASFTMMTEASTNLFERIRSRYNISTQNKHVKQDHPARSFSKTKLNLHLTKELNGQKLLKRRSSAKLQLTTQKTFMTMEASEELKTVMQIKGMVKNSGDSFSNLLETSEWKAMASPFHNVSAINFRK